MASSSSRSSSEKPASTAGSSSARGESAESNHLAVPPRPLALLQITLVVEDLDATTAGFQEALGLEVAFRDPGVAQWGLVNAVLPMGTTFIELLAPTRVDAPGARHRARLGGDGGYMVILQVDDLAPWRTPLDEAGVRIAWEGETRNPEPGADWAGFHLHPEDTGGLMLSLDCPDPPDSWAGAGRDWRDFIRQDVVDGLLGFAMESPDPDRLAQRWAETLGRPLLAGRRIALDQGEIVFVPAHPTGSAAVECLASVKLRATDRSRVGETMMLGGVIFELA